MPVKQCLTTIGFKESRDTKFGDPGLQLQPSEHALSVSIFHTQDCVRQPAQGKTNVSDVLHKTHVCIVYCGVTAIFWPKLNVQCSLATERKKENMHKQQ